MRLTVFRAIVSMSMFTVLAFAVTPRFWENFLQEELLEGTLTGISLTWDGRLTPAPTYDRVFDTEQPFIFSMVRDQAGNIYLGTGHSGKIFHVDPQGKGSLYYHAPELDVFALAVDAAGVLYAGTSPDGKVYKITGPEKATEFCDPEDKYIWSLLFDDRGNLLVGTGGRGLVLKVNPKGEKSTFFDPSDANVTCLTRSNDGHILAGTSPGGLVLRIDPEGKAFTLLDTEMEEIRSLATDRFGTVYAVAAGSKGAGAAAPGKGEPPLVPTTGPLPIATIQALSAIGQRAVDSSASVTVPGGGQGSTGARSAIYAISAGGAAETVYTSKDTMIYDVIVETDGSALSSTGDRGRILRIDTERHVTVITDSPEEQITRLAKDAGTVWAAGSNQGRLYKMGAGTASSGSYESKPLDAKVVSSWGRISWNYAGNAGESVELRTRSGNTEKPDNTWSSWSPPYTSGRQISSPAARYFQWKAEFKRNAGADAPSVPGHLEKVAVAYLQHNLRPQVVSISVLPAGIALQSTPPLPPGSIGMSLSSAGKEGPALNSPRARGRDDQKLAPRQIVQPGAQSVTWKGADENDDDLEFSVYFRGADERDWKLLVKKSTETFYTLDGASLPDGSYRLKVVASDAPSNEFGKALIGELISRPFVISNGTPVVEVTNHSVEGRRVRVEFRASVGAGRIESAEFSIDGGEWSLVFPTDGIADSAEEQYRLSTPELPVGEHLIGLRAGDLNGNTGTAKLVVRIQ